MIWMLFGPSFFVVTVFAPSERMVYAYSISGVAVRSRPGSHTFSSRPIGSYVASVCLPLASTTAVGVPQAGSSVLVTRWPAGLVTVVEVTGWPCAGLYAVVVLRSRAS